MTKKAASFLSPRRLWPYRCHHVLALLVVCSTWVFPKTRADDEKSLFAPIASLLEKHCYSCHSGEQPKGQFSVTSPELFFEDGYVVSGDVANSHLMTLVTPKAGKAAMPKHRDPLTESELKTLRDWIEAGARWPTGQMIDEASVTDFGWWSYQPLKETDEPSVTSEWIRTPIDAFIADAHQKRELTAVSPANRRTLIRRLTFDLTGLPPTAADVDRFINDDSPDAYERLVDSLLASPRYGERWARHWLDVVKYADTHGYDKDKLRNNAWPYRDYVVQSFNDDKPYGQFAREQLAGDVLAPNSPDGIRALGFLAAGPWDFIGHVEVPESKQDGMVARNLDRDDMVSNVFNSFCSITIQCARCHNHKFDPITQQNYYGLQSVFAAIDRADRSFDETEKGTHRRRELAERVQDLEKQILTFRHKVEASNGQHLANLNAEISRLLETTAVSKTARFGYHSGISPHPNDEKWVQLEWDTPQVIHSIQLHPCHDEFAGIGHGFGFPVRFRVDVRSATAWKTLDTYSMTELSSPELAPVSIRVGESVSAIRVIAVELAERQNDYNFALAELRALDEHGTNVSSSAIVTSLDSIEAPDRWQRSNLVDGSWPTLSAHHETYEELTRRRDKLLTEIWSPQNREALAERERFLQRARSEFASLPSQQNVFAASTSFPAQGNFRPTNGKPRRVRVLHRGNVSQPREDAVPGTIPVQSGDSHRFPANLSESERRVALAEWLTDRDNPFVWRSIVNRIWQYHFGRGLVASPNDFGRMGQTPSHPELLDWLAKDFRDSGQSIKRLNKLIVMSSVYRQSSSSHDKNESIDGSNRYLWKFPRRRLDAEEVRDSMLFVSDTLNLQMGGPGFYLFELERTEHSPHYEYHRFNPADPASHRRSIYRFVVRSQPDPWMTTLDCADSSQSTPTRNETVTPLQALSLLNSRFTAVMAEKFSESLAAETPHLRTQIILAFRRVTQRQPTEQETQKLTAYAEQHGVPNLCRLLFNLSEFVYLD